MLLRLVREHDHSFSPEEIAIMTAAFQDALAVLQLKNREDPATLLVARAVFEAAKNGERDPIRLRDAAINSI